MYAHLMPALNSKTAFVVAGAQGEGTCEAAASPVAQLILSATTACHLSIFDLLEDFGTPEDNSSGLCKRRQSDEGVRGRAIARLRVLGETPESLAWAHEGWTGSETCRGLLAHACFAMPSPADTYLDASAACANVPAGEGELTRAHGRTKESCITPLAAAQAPLLSATGRFWLEGPLLAHILRQPAVGVDRSWVLRALQRLDLAVRVIDACGATLDVRETAERACIMLGVGQALLQFMAQTPQDAVRRRCHLANTGADALALSVILFIS